jgi:uncharacterized protein (DUF427 family)
MKATWEDTIIAESDKTGVIEGNHYLPPDSIKRIFYSKRHPHYLSLEGCGELLPRPDRRQV